MNAISEKDKRLIAEGEAKGLEKGKREGKRETAQKMKADGLPLDVIRKYNGLPAQEIAEL